MNFSLQQITAPGGVDTANNALPNFAVWTYNCAGSGGTGVVDSTLYPSTAQQDFIFMDGSYNNGLANALLVAIVGLPSSNYDVKLFGSRITPGAGRVGTYLVNGQTQTLDAYANTSNTITFANVPVGDVTIGGVVEHNAILLTCYVTGTNYGYLSVADLNAVPEPATMGLLILGALAALRRRR
jgi:hypothetical protein